MRRLKRTHPSLTEQGRPPMLRAIVVIMLIGALATSAQAQSEEPHWLWTHTTGSSNTESWNRHGDMGRSNSPFPSLAKCESVRVELAERMRAKGYAISEEGGPPERQTLNGDPSKYLITVYTCRPAQSQPTGLTPPTPVTSSRYGIWANVSTVDVYSGRSSGTGWRRLVPHQSFSSAEECEDFVAALRRVNAQSVGQIRGLVTLLECRR
jgi:hypothetical protein